MRPAPRDTVERDDVHRMPFASLVLPLRLPVQRGATAILGPKGARRLTGRHRRKMPVTMMVIAFGALSVPSSVDVPCASPMAMPVARIDSAESVWPVSSVTV